MTFSATDPGYAEGYHGQWVLDKDGNKYYSPLLFIIDEAKSVKQDIFNAKDRCSPDMTLVVSTPGENTGPFYDIISKEPPGWDVIPVTWRDCPHLLEGRAYTYRQNLIKKFGEDSPFIQSMIFGNFIKNSPPHGADTFVSP